MIALFIILLSAICYPLYTGDITRNWLNPEVQGYHIPIEIYNDISRRISRDYWTFLAPSKYDYITYNESDGLWEAGNPYPKIIDFPYISGLGTEYIKSSSNSFIQFIYSIFHSDEYNSENVVKLFSLIGVKHVLVEKNVVSGAKDVADIYLNKLSGLNNVKIVSQYSDRILLEIDMANKIIYIAKNYLFYHNYTDLVKGIQSISNLDDINELVFIEDSNRYIYDFLNSYPSIVGSGEIRNIQMISPSHYIVDVYTENNFILVLQQSYDDNWIVYVNGVPLDQKYHFKTNGYGNGWLIPMKGYLRIEILYKPSIVATIIEISSIITLIVFTIYVIIKRTSIYKQLL